VPSSMLLSRARYVGTKRDKLECDSKKKLYHHAENPLLTPSVLSWKMTLVHDAENPLLTLSVLSWKMNLVHDAENPLPTLSVLSWKMTLVHDAENPLLTLSVLRLKMTWVHLAVHLSQDIRGRMLVVSVWIVLLPHSYPLAGWTTHSAIPPTHRTQGAVETYPEIQRFLRDEMYHDADTLADSKETDHQ
jgi:hypothetical protein